MKNKTHEGYLSRAKSTATRKWDRYKVDKKEHTVAWISTALYIVLGFYILNLLWPPAIPSSQIPTLIGNYDIDNGGLYQFNERMGDITSITVKNEEYKKARSTSVDKAYTEFYKNGIRNLGTVRVESPEENTISIYGIDEENRELVKINYDLPREYWTVGIFAVAWFICLIVIASIKVARDDALRKSPRDGPFIFVPLLLPPSILLRLYYLVKYNMSVRSETKIISVPGSIERAEIELLLIETKTKSILEDIASKLNKTKRAIEAVRKVDVNGETKDKLMIKLEAQLDWFIREKEGLEVYFAKTQEYFKEKLRFSSEILSLRTLLDAVQTAKENEEFIKVAHTTIANLHGTANEALATLEEKSSEIGNYMLALEEINLSSKETYVPALLG